MYPTPTIMHLALTRHTMAKMDYVVGLPRELLSKPASQQDAESPRMSRANGQLGGSEGGSTRSQPTQTARTHT